MVIVGKRTNSKWKSLAEYRAATNSTSGGAITSTDHNDGNFDDNTDSIRNEFADPNWENAIKNDVMTEAFEENELMEENELIEEAAN